MISNMLYTLIYYYDLSTTTIAVVQKLFRLANNKYVVLDITEVCKACQPEQVYLWKNGRESTHVSLISNTLLRWDHFFMSLYLVIVI